MAWLRVDDGFTSNAKVAQLTDSEFRVWLRLLCHCARSHDPSVDPAARREVTGLTPKKVSKFASLSLLDQVGNHYEIHNWILYQPKDEFGAERQARWRSRQAVEPKQSEEDAVTSAVTESLPRVRARAGSRPVPSLENTETSVSVRTPAQELVGWFVAESVKAGREPPSRVTGQIAQQVGQLLAETTCERIRAGLRIVIDKGLNPSTLPSAVYEAQAPRANNRGVSAADLLAAADREEAVLEPR